jgi:mono/diheme cytochrome c family protein
MKKVIPAVIIFIFATAFSLQQQPAGLKAAIARGKTVYENYCLACHQQDGSGVPNMNPPLAKTKWVLGDKKALTKIILKGLQGGEIEIDGDKFHNPMPPQESVLTDQEIADVLTYVRNSFGNKASMVTMAEVKALRAKLK